MTLHDRICRLECREGYSTHVRHGFYMAKNEAAALAKEADELMAEMADLIEGYKLIMQEMGVRPNKTDALLTKYNTYKESNQ